MDLQVEIGESSTATTSGQYTVRFLDLAWIMEMHTRLPVVATEDGSADIPELEVKAKGKPDKTRFIARNIGIRLHAYNNQAGLNCKTALVGMLNALSTNGLTVTNSPREDGHGTEMAIRLKLDGYDGRYLEIAGTDVGPETTCPRPRGQRYMADAAKRRAIENRAVEIAIAHYRSRYGPSVAITDTGATCPYDLELKSDGLAVRVEVKGTQGQGEEVLLTKNEINHARQQTSGGYQVDLFVVGGIEVECNDGMKPVARGGKLATLIERWHPSDEDLTPTQFRYEIPQ